MQLLSVESYVKSIHPKRNNMKLTRLLTCLFICIIAISCIQDEALNAETDILTCELPNAKDDILDMDIENDKIIVWASPGIDIENMALEFTMTKGATINPESGSVHDFTTPKFYEVTSEDGNWSKRYEVSVIIADIPTQFDFENVKLKDKYQVFYEVDDKNLPCMTWASGNPGFALTGSGKAPEDYPTMSAPDGINGKCLKLTTRSTGFFGSGVGMPIAAGNLFMGSFDTKNALTNALKSTRFGFPFAYEPIALKGFYKYKSGGVFTEGKVTVPGKKDQCDIYAIFYETDDELKRLDGTNQFSHPNLVAVARIANQKETDQWVEFNIPFVMKPGKTIDNNKLKNKKYNVAIVFSSSLEGDHFNGSVGSTLYIDNVELEYKAD